MADSACPSRAGGAEGHCPRGLATLQLLPVFTVADAVAAVVIKAMELVGLVSRMP